MYCQLILFLYLCSENNKHTQKLNSKNKHTQKLSSIQITCNLVSFIERLLGATLVIYSSPRGRYLIITNFIQQLMFSYYLILLQFEQITLMPKYMVLMYNVTPLPPMCPQLHNCLYVISNPIIIPPPLLKSQDLVKNLKYT